MEGPQKETARGKDLTGDACAGIVSDMETDHFEDELPDACGDRGCYPDRRCAKCRLADGDSCEACGAPGEVVDEDVLCASCATKGA